MKLPGRTLDRKMWRELWRLRGQLLSISLVVATAVVTVVTLRGSYEALRDARDDYYAGYRLPHVWVELERAPERVARSIQAIPGVASVVTRVRTYATLDLPWLDTPGLGLFRSMPDHGSPSIGDVHVSLGRRVAPERSDEVMVGEAFFNANGLSLGDSVYAVLDGRFRALRIVGVALSPEHSYSIPPGALYPEDERYGVFWMARSILGPALDADQAFNEVAVSLSPGADPARVIRELDRLLEPYGGLGAYGREDQLSYRIVEDELAQTRSMSIVVPAVFLGVAAFLLNLVLSRLIATQRTEIGTLKAFGYGNAAVGWHYLSYAVVAVAAGTVVGVVGGLWAGGAIVDLYGEYFRFPVLEYQLSWTLVLIGGGISLAAAIVGGWSTVRRATRLAPAEAMRPEPPATFRPGWLERAGVGNVLSPGGRLILRDMERRPVRSLLSSLGVAFSVAILVVGSFMFDSASRMMDLQFRIAQKEDLSVSFNQPLGPSALHDLARMRGVTRAEPFHQVPVRLRAGHRERTLAIVGHAPDTRLRAIVGSEGRPHPLPLRGLVLSGIVADGLGLGPGDDVVVEVLTGKRLVAQVRVAGVVDDFLGSSAFMSLESLRTLTGEGPRISGAYLAVDPGSRDDVNRALKDAPVVASVASPQTMLASFEDQLEGTLYVAVGFMLVFASIISVAVIYNGTRIALSERSRELASLRVLGFTRAEVARLLLGEQAVVTLIAIPVGSVIGYLLAGAVLAGVASETYRIPLVVSPRTYLFAAAVTLVAAMASGGLVRRRLDRMDLVSVLKTRE